MVYGLLTVLNIKDMGFFIPHRYAAGLERDKNKTCWIHKWFSEDKIDAFSDTLETVSAFNKDLKKIDYQPRSKNTHPVGIKIGSLDLMQQLLIVSLDRKNPKIL